MIYNLLSTRSSKWKTVRNNHLNKQTHCQACGTYKNLQVHHIIPVSIDKTKELDYNNLITLCKTCHFVFGHFMDWNSWNKNVIEDSEVYYKKVLNKPYNLKGQFYDKNIFGIINDSIRNIIFFWHNRS
jgi:hypothetical protein